MLYQSFCNLLNSHIATHYQEIVKLLLQSDSKTVENVSFTYRYIDIVLLNLPSILGIDDIEWSDRAHQ